MKKLGLLMIIATILISLSASDGFAFQLGGKEMVKNGAGIRQNLLLEHCITQHCGCLLH